MRAIAVSFFVMLTVAAGSVRGAIAISSPTARHIVQRSDANVGDIAISGTYTETPDLIEARAVVMAGTSNSGSTTAWQTIDAAPASGSFSGTLTNVVAGGWYQIEVRAVTGGTPGDAAVVQRVGVGDVYVTAGQSNSANYGNPAYTPADDRVSARTSVSVMSWRHAYDPMPIAGGGGGSVWSRLGNELAAAENVPIGFIALGVGSTQVSQWVPGTAYYNTLLKPAIQSFPVHGFRAVLWHQGESDSLASVTAATHTSRLNAMISQSRIDAGWDVPWYVAEVSFHPSSSLVQEEPVAAGQRQAAYGDPLTGLGPSTDPFHLEDASGGKLADSVHFNAAGLLDHASQWRDILRGVIAFGLRNGGFEENCDAAITGLAPLAEGASHIVSITGNGDSPSVLGWRILSASGVTAADGTNGFHNPTTGTYAAEAGRTNHVALLNGGAAGNHFLQTTRMCARTGTIYTLNVALGVRDAPASFGGARLEIVTNGATAASAEFDKAALDALCGGNAAGTFTDASVSWASGGTVTADTLLAVRIGKPGGAGTVLDFDDVRFFAADYNDTNAPTPDPMTFASPPAGLSATAIGMTATTATDASPPLQYLFTNTVNGHVSGWISSVGWTNTGLTEGGTYTYRVKARDGLGNETAWSAEATWSEWWAGEITNFTASFVNWNKKMLISFPWYAGSETLTNFPALVMLRTNMPGFRYSEFTTADARDLRFANYEITGALDYEIEKWDTNGTSYVWVRVPELKAGTRIWAAWGNSQATGTPPWTAHGSVWGNEYDLVWHMTNAGAYIYDSTANRVSGTIQGAYSNRTGQISTGLNLGTSSGKTNRVVIAEEDRIKLGTEWTISAWCRNLMPHIGARRALVGGDWGDLQIFAAISSTNIGTFDLAGGTNYPSEAVMLRTTVWQHVTAVGWGTNTDIYVNGSYAGRCYYKSTNDVRYIGNSSNDYKFAEDLDEFRVERKARSAKWMQSRWMSEASNSVFTKYSDALPSGNVDGNGNGIPDWWEVVWFGGTNTSDGDWDKDSFADNDEWVAGTDPTNMASLLRLAVIRTNADSSVLRFDMLPAEGEGYYGRWRYYDLQFSTNLVKAGGGWTGVAGLTDIPGENRAMIYTNSQSWPAKFYRVRARLEP